MVRHTPLLVLLACVACSNEPSVSAPPENRAQRLAVLDRIASQCQVARSAFVLVGEEELRVNLGGEENFEKVECVLRHVDGLNLPPGNVNFIVDRGSAASTANQAAPATNEAVPAANQAAPAGGTNAQAD